MFDPKCYRDPEFAFPRTTLALKLNGFWPCPRRAGKSLQLLPVLYDMWAWFTIVSVAFVIYGEVAFLIQSFDDVTQSTENLCTTMMGIISDTRLLHARFFQREIQMLLQQFVDIIWIAKGTQPSIERDCRHNMRIFNVMALLLTMALIMYLTFPLIYMLISGPTLDSPDKPLPYKMIFPYDTQRGWRYIFTYLMAVYTGVVSVTQFFGQDAIFGLFVHYTCGQFKILHRQIAQLVPQCHEQHRRANSEGAAIKGPSLQQRYAQRLHELALRHSALVDFCELLEKFNSFPLLVNFVVSMFLICVLAFQMATANIVFVFDYVKFAVYFVSMTAQLYAICQSGQSLITNSTDTASYLYACNWEGGALSEPLALELNTPSDWHSLTLRQRFDYCPADKHFCRKLSFMIMRSQRPVELTAMRFSVLSSESFTTILSSSMSYFMLLRALVEK